MISHLFIIPLQIMNANEKNQIKEYLLKERDKLILRISDLRELTAPIEPDSAIGRLSRMDAIVNSTINKEAFNKLTEKLKKINISLDKIDDTDFGLCLQCRNPIPFQRLLIAPGSLCVKCAR